MKNSDLFFKKRWFPWVIKSGSTLRNNKGFTLLETLVAITILTMATLGPMQLASRMVASARVAQNRIVAFYLAQEGIEYSRNTRDNNFLNSSNGWLDGLDACFGANGCIIDVPNASIVACDTECPDIKYDDSSGYYYNYIKGVPTMFKRVVKITPNVGGNPDEANVKSVVSWKDNTGKKSVVLEEDIFNWR